VITLSRHNFSFFASAGSLGLAGLGEGMDPWRQARRRWAYARGRLDHSKFVTVTKTLTYLSRSGNHKWYAPWTSVRSVGPTSLVNCVSLTNPGVREFAEYYYPKLVTRRIPFVVSVAPESAFDAMRIGVFIRKKCPLALAIEYNTLCPNAASHHIAGKAGAAHNLAESGLPVILKLPADEYDILKHFKPAAVSLINAVPWAKARDAGLVEGDSPLARYGYDGSVSGSTITTTSYRCLIEFKDRFPHIPVISGGGVMNADEAASRFEVGADAVGFWTLFDKDPSAPNRIIAQYTN
jgi:dihydroorotate dehydrogenase